MKSHRQCVRLYTHKYTLSPKTIEHCTLCTARAHNAVPINICLTEAAAGKRFSITNRTFYAYILVYRRVYVCMRAGRGFLCIAPGVVSLSYTYSWTHRKERTLCVFWCEFPIIIILLSLFDEFKYK